MNLKTKMRNFKKVFFLIIFIIQIYALFKLGQYFGSDEDFANDVSEISSKRIDTLLNKLNKEEKKYTSVLKWLKIDIFKQNEYIHIKDDKLFSTQEFLTLLKNISEAYTFKKSNLSKVFILRF